MLISNLKNLDKIYNKRIARNHFMDLLAVERAVRSDIEY